MWIFFHAYTTNISFATWKYILVGGILTPTYFRLTFKDALHRSVYLRNLENHWPPEISFILHAQGLRERQGAVSVLSVCSPPFQRIPFLFLSLPLPPSVSPSHALSFSFSRVPISGSRNFSRKITTKISLSERLLVICSEIMDLPGVWAREKEGNV